MTQICVRFNSRVHLESSKMQPLSKISTQSAQKAHIKAHTATYRYIAINCA